MRIWFVCQSTDPPPWHATCVMPPLIFMTDFLHNQGRWTYFSYSTL